jgi:hypothetical protein
VAERALIGTWVMDEVRLAVQKGYQIIEVYEMYEYKVRQYNPKTGRGGLFAEYIDTFLKLKSQASGYRPGFEPQMTRTATCRASRRAKAFVWIRIQSDITPRNVPWPNSV